MSNTLKRFNRVILLFVVTLLSGLLVSTALGALPDPVIDQSQGVDQSVNYLDMAKYAPWDDRNYQVTKEDIKWLADNELELFPGIPVFFRVELRKEFPSLLRTGPVQYPRAALQLFYLRYGGVMRNGVIVDPAPVKGPSDDKVAVPINGEQQLNSVLGANEITIEINPADANQAIAGSNNNGGQEMYWSTNGGVSWTIQGVLPDTCCDPTIGWSSDGTVGYVGALSGAIGVSFWRTFDGGKNWVDRVNLTASGSDKEFLHVDISPTSPYQDNVYLTYHNSNTMQFARSSNQGASFDITAFGGAPSGIGSDITTDSAGNIFYFYGATSAQTITMLKSTNGGTTFASPMTVASTNGSFDFPIPAMETRRAWIYTSTDADRSTGTYAGSVYVAFTDTSAPENNGSATANHTQIHVFYSRDGGATWDSSIPHPTDDVLTVDRFNQWLTVDEFGTVHVIFYDTRHSASRTGVDLYYTFSTDGAQTWNELTRVSASTSANLTDGQEWGDYNGISVVNDLVIPAWTDNRAGPPNEKDVYAADLDNLGAEPGFQLAGDNLQQLICAPADLDPINLQVLSVLEFSNPVTLALQNEPAGVTSSFSVNPVVPASPAAESSLTVSVSGAVSAGDYIFQVTGSAADASDKSLNIELGASTAAAGTTTLVSPADAAVDQPTSPTLSWSAAIQGASYLVDIDDDPAFGSIDYQTTLGETSHELQSALSTDTTYYWRVRASNACGDGAFSTSFSFTTSTELCSTPNVAIPDASTEGVSDPFVVGASGIITDLDVSLLATHTYVGDLIFTLTHEDTGVSVVMVDRPGVPLTTFGCSADDIDLLLDDDAANPVETGCGSLNIGDAFQPNNPLSAFNGEDIGGTWTLTVVDLASPDPGTLDEWCLFPALSVPDSDGDGIADNVDNCPDDPNPNQEDFDADGLGYVCDNTCATDMDFAHDFAASDLFDLKASNVIQYQGSMASGADITLDGGGGVVLKPGTSIQTGAALAVRITGCPP